MAIVEIHKSLRNKSGNILWDSKSHTFSGGKNCFLCVSRNHMAWLNQLVTPQPLARSRVCRWEKRYSSYPEPWRCWGPAWTCASDSGAAAEWGSRVPPPRPPRPASTRSLRSYGSREKQKVEPTFLLSTCIWSSWWMSVCVCVYMQTCLTLAFSVLTGSLSRETARLKTTRSSSTRADCRRTSRGQDVDHHVFHRHGDHVQIKLAFRTQTYLENDRKLCQMSFSSSPVKWHRVLFSLNSPGDVSVLIFWQKTPHIGGTETRLFDLNCSWYGEYQMWRDFEQISQHHGPC